MYTVLFLIENLFATMGYWKTSLCFVMENKRCKEKIRDVKRKYCI